MSFDAEDFYSLAIWLVEHNIDEASLRTAISRVYYAGHLLAVRRLMRGHWEPKGTGEDHRGVIRELRNRRTRNLADNLAQLLELRMHADYHVEVSDSVINRDCKFCRKIRESPSPSEPATHWSHWEEVKEIGEHLLPLLRSL